MEKTASMHKGKKTSNSGGGSPFHNQRLKQTGKHINDNLSHLNIYYDFTAEKFGLKDVNFAESEDLFYQKVFSPIVENRCAHYKKKGNKKLATKTLDDYKKEHPPIETIFQVGNSFNCDQWTREQANEVYQLYVTRFNEEMKQRRQKYDCDAYVFLLNAALHCDETSPHIHERSIALIKTKMGYFDNNQNQTLRALGFERPEPTKKESKYNNPLVSFTAWQRELFVDTCEDLGLDIQATGTQAGTQGHKEKLDYIRENTRAKQQALELLDVVYNQKNIDLDDEFKRGVQEKQKQINENKRTIKNQESKIETNQTIIAGQEDSIDQNNITLENQEEQIELYELADKVNDWYAAILETYNNTMDAINQTIINDDLKRRKQKEALKVLTSAKQPLKPITDAFKAKGLTVPDTSHIKDYKTTQKTAEKE